MNRSRVLFPFLLSKDFHFENFFAAGMQLHDSPLLHEGSFLLSRNLRLKASFFALIFWVASLFCLIIGSKSLESLFLLFTFFLAGLPALIDALEDLFEKKIHLDILMTLSAFASLALGNGLEGGLLLVLFSFSKAFEDLVQSRAKKSLIHLKELSPAKAFVIKNEEIASYSIANIKVGERILVKAGEVFPLDVKILSGSTTITTAHLTGESLPLFKTVSDEIPGGAQNGEGAVICEVLRTSNESMIARIIRLVADASISKPAWQNKLDQFGAFYSKAILLIAALISLLPLLFHAYPFLGKEGAFYRSLSFLIAASPCALLLSTPIAYLSALSACAKKGVLVKGASLLHCLPQCKKIAFDKTGTLTTGELSFLGIDSLESTAIPLKILSLAYGLERNSTHPIANSISTYCAAKKIQSPKIDDFLSFPGRGVQGFFQNEPIFIGNAAWISSFLLEEKKNLLLAHSQKRYEQGEILTALQYRGETFVLRFKDTLRKEAFLTISKLKSQFFLDPLLLTGDTSLVGQAIAKEVGISECFTELSPEKKLSWIEKLSKHEPLAMVGDGINDAPALAKASVGIAMGKNGSAAAVESADIVLLQDNLDSLPWLFQKAFSTQKIIYQNLIFASAALIIASSSALFGAIPLWLAVLVHEGGTILVGLNALRLLKR